MNSINEMLIEYGEIQDKMADLDARKKELRDNIVKELDGKMTGKTKSFSVNNTSYLVTCSKSKVISYDEESLQRALGPDYPKVLSVDMSKLKKNIKSVEYVLNPFLGIIGSPDEKRIESLINAGEIKTPLIKSAQKISEKLTFSVKKEKLA